MNESEEPTVSEEEKRRGQQGVQGIQGIEGEPGKQGKPGEGSRGERGLAGVAGERGDRGRTGSQPRAVILSFWAVVIVTSVVLTGLAYTIRQNRQNIAANHRLAADGQKAHDALCAQNNFLRARVRDSRKFLIDHPNGVPSGTAALLRIQIASQEKTVAAVAPYLGTCRNFK